jgi:hypothetical protein
MTLSQRLRKVASSWVEDLKKEISSYKKQLDVLDKLIKALYRFPNKNKGKYNDLINKYNDIDQKLYKTETDLKFALIVKNVKKDKNLQDK